MKDALVAELKDEVSNLKDAALLHATSISPLIENKMNLFGELQIDFSHE